MSVSYTHLAADAAALIPDGASVMIGGFMGVGSPDRIIDALVARRVRGLTVIGNDTAFPGVGIGKLIDAGCVAQAKLSHIGTNPVTQNKMIAGEIEIDLIPQGTLAERIRAGGNGLGGILTPTGVGTVVEKGKRIIEVEGRALSLIHILQNLRMRRRRQSHGYESSDRERGTNGKIRTRDTAPSCT